MATQSIRLISWNVNGRVKCLSDQSGALALRNPDVVALQEVVPTTVALWHEKLRQTGWYTLDSFACGPLQNTKRRQYGTFLASRWPLIPLPPMCVPWPERVLSALLKTPWDEIEIHTVGIPPGVSNGLIKVEMFEGIFACLASQTDHLRILCGDLNSPKAEFADRRIVTWGQLVSADGSVRIPRTRDSRDVDSWARWDAAERNVVEGLARFDLSDVFRKLNGFEVQEYSWYWKGKTDPVGRRFDHVFASERLHAVGCQYLHDFRKEGLSDHSAIEVDFSPIGRRCHVIAS